ncbi:MAG: hypothetical protein ACKV2Q_19435 [Planctomycetaceae bacterium]
MTLTLSLPEGIEHRLTEAARGQQLGTGELTLRLLDAHLPPVSRRQKLAALIRSWIEDDDETEQKETGEWLIQALDEDRPSERKLFPPELKGVTW